MPELARCLPKGMKLNDHQGNPVVFESIIVGIDGGYAYNEYLRCRAQSNKEDLYINLSIADSTFKLQEKYTELMDMKLSDLDDASFEFLSNVKLNNVVWPSPANES